MAELFDFQKKWERLVNKVFGKKDLSGSVRDLAGYKSLSPQERVWFNVQSLIQEIGDGGLLQYYSNSAADTIDDCMADLDVLGAASMKQLLIDVNKFFPDGVSANLGD